MLSSSIAVPAKFEPASMNVGNVPVVNPFNLCKVVVGGSAMNGKRMALSGCLEAVSYKTGKALWKKRAFSSIFFFFKFTFNSYLLSSLLLPPSFFPFFFFPPPSEYEECVFVSSKGERPHSDL